MLIKQLQGGFANFRTSVHLYAFNLALHNSFPTGVRLLNERGQPDAHLLGCIEDGLPGFPVYRNPV